MVEVPMVESFERRLDRHWREHPQLYVHLHMCAQFFHKIECEGEGTRDGKNVREKE